MENELEFTSKYINQLVNYFETTIIACHDKVRFFETRENQYLILFSNMDK